MPMQFYTSENRVMAKEEIFASQPLSSVTTVSIDETPSAKSFLGFGVAITGSSCYLLHQMEETERTQLLKNIYTKEGLNLSVGRLTIGSSDYSPEIYSYDDVPFDTELTHFSIERDRAYIIPMVQEILKIKPDLYLFASPWSPPGWMKTGGSLYGGFMREQFVECYADYIIKYIKAYAECGIKISAITPQNEAQTDQNGISPACYWHPETEAKFIHVLRKKLDEQNLNVKIWMLDHNFAYVNRVVWSLDNLSHLQENCDGAAFHYYDGGVEKTKILKEKYPDFELHFTEGGPRLYDNYATDWVKWGIVISRTLSCGFSSFTGWNLMLDETGNPNVGPFSCGGLVTRNSATGELTYSGQYRAFRHIAPYITKDSCIYPVISNETEGLFSYPERNLPVEGFFVQNKEHASVLVLVNPKSGKQQIQFCFNGTRYYAELKPDSISTIVL